MWGWVDVSKYLYFILVKIIKPFFTLPSVVNVRPKDNIKKKIKAMFGQQTISLLRYILVSVPTCPALTVGSVVKTTPNTCVTSQMKTNTKCSFSCPQGYQLQGPSYKQCRANGQWTSSAKSVSCSGKFLLIISSVLLMCQYMEHVTLSYSFLSQIIFSTAGKGLVLINGNP